MSSWRLPGKIMLPINGQPMIFWQIQRILTAKYVSKLVIATSNDKSDDDFAKFGSELGIEIFRGSLSNVHSRFISIINLHPEYEHIVRLTGDCPLTMANLLDSALETFSSNNFEYMSNCIEPTFPDGLDIEIFTRNAFQRMSSMELTSSEEEHVTSKFREKEFGFVIGEFRNDINLSALRWTVDYKGDYDFVAGIFEHFKGKETLFDMQDILNLLSRKPELNTSLSGKLRNISLQED